MQLVFFHGYHVSIEGFEVLWYYKLWLECSFLVANLPFMQLVVTLNYNILYYFV